MGRKCLLFIILIGVSNILAAGGNQAVQPAVAIRTPLIEDSVRRSKLLDPTILRQELETALRATRKFRVLTRDKAMLGAVMEEQDFARSRATLGDAAPTGKLRNAHYIIQPVVHDFVMGRGCRKIPVLEGKYKCRDSGRIRVTAQMLDTETGQIVTTFTLASKFATGTWNQNGRGSGPSKKRFVTMAQQLGAQLADQMIAQVYPMKVVKRSGGQVIINRGQDGGLKQGEVLKAYTAGEELIDPDTGESLGVAEEYAGKVKVTRILPKITYATIVEESVPIDRGFILRKQ
ncbi:MAG TPA: hypothetical protein ENI90_02545 [Methylothermaceae bacterium]|nr:hypothetical protein [Methylothermaceae bacterium]